MRLALGVIGAIFGLVAGVIISSAVGMDIAVVSDGYEVANFSLMHAQAVAVALGIGAGIISAMLLCTAALMGRGQ